jgi:hypothetical protein
MNPANLTLRFLLEVTALGALAWWGWSLTDSWWRWLAAIAVVLLVALAWGVFAIPGDPSRGGQGIVKVPGIVRLALELLVFGAGAYAFKAVGRPNLAIGMVALVAVHYAWSYERVAWLLKQ